MTGFLVVNAYLNSDKFTSLNWHLLSAAEKLNIDLKVKTNEEMLFCEERPDFVLFWDKDIMLARLLEKRGLRVFNSARAIELCDDKGKTYLSLLGEVAQPETIIAPLSFFDTDYSGFVKKAGEKLDFPLVYKERFGSFGEQVSLCNDESEVISRINGKPFLLQRFVKESSGRDMRLEVVGNRVIAAMKRENKHDFRSNLTGGGTAEKYSPTEYEKNLAIKSCRALGLDFGGVDILCDGSVCEVNSNAHILNLLNATGIDAAKIIFEYILGKIQ